mgnify:CR=1 FL=1
MLTHFHVAGVDTLKERLDAPSVPSHPYTMPRMSSLKSERLVGSLQECVVVGRVCAAVTSNLCHTDKASCGQLEA